MVVAILLNDDMTLSGPDGTNVIMAAMIMAPMMLYSSIETALRSAAKALARERILCMNAMSLGGIVGAGYDDNLLFQYYVYENNTIRICPIAAARAGVPLFFGRG